MLLTIQIIAVLLFFVEIISAGEFCFSFTKVGACLFRSFRKFLVMNDDTKSKKYFTRVMYKFVLTSWS